MTNYFPHIATEYPNSAYPKVDTNGAEFLVILNSESVKDSERRERESVRAILSDVQAEGTWAMGEVSADLCNALMDLEEILH